MSPLGWFRGAAPKPSASPAASQVDLTAEEIAQIQDAMRSASLIMNDDIEGAEEKLKTGGKSTFHQLGMGVCIFMRSVLGVEKSIMTEASTLLADCENSAWSDMKKAQKEAGTTTPLPGRVYSPGTEYALVQAEAQLMSTIVALLHESLTEGIRAFYKLRKAYMALDAIMQAEEAYFKQHGTKTNGAQEEISAPKEEEKGAPTATGKAKENTEDSDLEFVDAPEGHSGEQTPITYEGHLAKENEVEKKMGDLVLDSEADKAAAQKSTEAKAYLENNIDSSILTHEVDIFIHSGANMCFGVLMLVLSMIPPAFSKLLSIVGFHGDRERGVRMLWQSTQFDNINGAVAGLMLFAYYNGLLGLSDILPNEEDVKNGAVMGYPRDKCEALLAKMRTLYPESGLWRLEQSRLLSSNKDLPGAINVLKGNLECKMRQVTALNSFELSLDSMHVQDYAGMRDSFLRCVELNDWSHALYYYIAGCGELELYRDAYHATGDKRDEAVIKAHKKRVEELLRKAPTVAGKKRFMAKPLPFEVFVQRKVQKWEDRARALGIDLADAPGASPSQEMSYLWNGPKKMSTVQLERMQAALSWDRLTASEKACASIRAEADEQATYDICLATVLRHLGNIGEARKLLEAVIAKDKSAFKGANADDYALPAAHYEMAVLAWTEVQYPELAVTSEGSDGSEVAADKTPHRRKKFDECASWLDTVAKWDAYLLDARFGMRLNTGQDTLRWYRREYEWAR